MAVSQVGALTREFGMVEIGIWGNNGGKRVKPLTRGAIKQGFTVYK